MEVQALNALLPCTKKHGIVTSNVEVLGRKINRLGRWTNHSMSEMFVCILAQLGRAAVIKL